jgi:hypothetical protein
LNTTLAQRPAAVPASAVLRAWQEHPWTGGISVDQLSPLDRLIVNTRHSVYEVVATAANSPEVLVRGGSFFPEFTSVRLSGCSLGGSFLKLRSVHVGFCMEFALDKRVIVTSPVRSISLAQSRTDAEVM